MKLFTSLAIFYLNGPFDGYVCLARKNSDDGGILFLPRVECKFKQTSHETANLMFNWATNIEKWPIPIHRVDVEEYDNTVDIIYMVTLPGQQKLSKDYEWVKISSLSTLGISEKDLETIRNAGMRRF